jgi:hypothetical protein
VKAAGIVWHITSSQLIRSERPSASASSAAFFCEWPKRRLMPDLADGNTKEQGKYSGGVDAE